MTSKIRAVFFWGGIILYLCSFSLPAIMEVDTSIVRPGYDCALMSILVVGMIPDLFRFGYSLLHCVLETAAIILVAPINLVLLLYAIASPFRPADRTVHVSRILIPLSIPFSWVIFHYEDYRPVEGHFLWVLGVLLVLVSGYSAARN